MMLHIEPSADVQTLYKSGMGHACEEQGSHHKNSVLKFRRSYQSSVASGIIIIGS